MAGERSRYAQEFKDEAVRFANTSRVARPNNSTGYFRDLAITGASSSARTDPGSQVLT
jgi:hypothetical protein